MTRLLTCGFEAGAAAHDLAGDENEAAITQWLIGTWGEVAHNFDLGDFLTWRYPDDVLSRSH